jgi:tetratricopeptide (TPR) repeat protein
MIAVSILAVVVSVWIGLNFGKPAATASNRNPISPKQGDANADLASLIQQGCDLYNRRLFESAEDCFLRATHIDPIRADAWWWLGKCRVRKPKPDYEGARFPFNEAIRLGNDKHPAYYQARAYMRWKGFKDGQAALSDCDIALKLDPKDTNTAKLRDEIRVALERDQLESH